jgi:hypothetical protein
MHSKISSRSVSARGTARRKPINES